MGIRRTLVESRPGSMVLAAGAYVLYKVQLPLAERRDRRAGNSSKSEPVPPARLRFRVHGALDEASYLKVGKVVADNIRDLCRIADRDFYEFKDILDFGCGCGRVIQNFRGQSGSPNLYATDIDPDLVAWGQANLDGIQWSVNGHQPPLPFEANAFDLIYGISVFTHLDEDFQNAWLRDFNASRAPGQP